MALEVKLPIYSVRCFDGELHSVKRNATIVWIYLFVYFFRVKYLFIFRAFFFSFSCRHVKDKGKQRERGSIRDSEREEGKERKMQREGERGGENSWA